MKTIFVFNAEDGDNIGVIVKAALSVADPAQEFKAVARTFRVVANTYGPTLELVPLAETMRLTELPRSTYSERRQNLLNNIRSSNVPVGYWPKNDTLEGGFKTDFVTFSDYYSGFSKEEFIFSRQEIENK